MLALLLALCEMTSHRIGAIDWDPPSNGINSHVSTSQLRPGKVVKTLLAEVAADFKMEAKKAYGMWLVGRIPSQPVKNNVDA